MENESSLMHLEVLLPFRVFADHTDVKRIVAETQEGAFGLLPARLDCVAALVPGILTYETESEGETHIAIDEGILVKAGQKVFVSVRNAIGGTDLGQLHQAVEQEFLNLNEQERNMRVVLAKLESGLVRQLLAYRHE
ncbi:MAG: F0F1 ATP synthase subunit epsilon [Phaeodactylibacter sp.]|nr:F0F1 ATP synthase subunit epsilon [Phaeodactylibacter sp.]MCB0616211.1 F0F1 ATP synthase subunit epsilon [Phaeodactylibacter sp.]HQU60726.1 F0F1 ATP synthase subunit epsilon [Saprospiraceae bacterium]